jgi:poly(hydroxyalkanoate) synthase III subunit E
MAPANPPWLQTLLDAQRELARLGMAGPSTASSPVAAAQQRLADYASEYAGLAAAALAPWQADNAPLVARYQALFMPRGLLPAHPDTARDGAAWLRMQRAGERYARLASAIATDAGRRLAAALSASGPAAPPVTSLRELHALWIECGEAAWAAAAHRDEFAEAQAELLAAHVELAAAAAPR